MPFWMRLIAFVLFIISTAVGRAQTSVDPLDVAAAFSAVNINTPSRFTLQKPSGLTWPKGAAAGPSFHQQGIQKTSRNEFVVTGSASETGYIYFTDRDCEVRNIITLTDGSLNHFGGFQITEDFLAVGYEQLKDKEHATGPSGNSKVLFYDVRDINHLKRLEHLTIVRSSANSTAGAVALSRFGEKWLTIVANWDSNRLDFYLSNAAELEAATTTFNPIGSWSKGVSEFSEGSIDDNWAPYQNINLLQQKDGQLFFIGMHTNKFALMADYADLYKLKIGPKEIQVQKVAKAHFKAAGPRFLYGSGVFWNSSEGQMEVYACEGHPPDEKREMVCNRWE